MTSALPPTRKGVTFNSDVIDNENKDEQPQKSQNDMSSGAVETGVLMEQNLEKLGKENLNALTPEVISRQATINIGTIGHVAHGKSTGFGLM